MPSLTSSHRVFVYGMLLREEYGTPAQLPGYRLEFRGGLATVREDPDATLHGAVLDVDESGLRYFDKIEGYMPDRPKESLYLRVKIETTEGEAYVYIMNDRQFPLSPPGLGYLHTIHCGYIAYGLPVDALEEAVHAAHGATI